MFESMSAGVGRVVGEAAEGLGSLVDAPVWSLTDDELAALLGAIRRARGGLDEVEARLVRLAEEREVPRAAGSTSTTAWLAAVTGISRSAAARTVSTARLVREDCEPIRRAWAAGGLTAEQVRVIVDAVDKLPDWCGAGERHDAQVRLIALAAEHSLDDLKRLANRVVEVIDPDGADEILGAQLQAQEKRAWDATRLSMRRCGDGTTRGLFVVPDADADVLRAAVEGIAAPRRNHLNAQAHDMSVDDLRALPHQQKLGLAFLELIGHLPQDILPQAGALAATVAVTVPIDVMRSGLGTATTSSNTQISAAKARRLACNALLVALYLDTGSRIIDHGMTKRLFTKHQKLALATRDGGCVWQGCDRPPAWCEAHHLDFWSEDGPTNLDNGALFCHFHHFLLHEGQWTARMASDGVVEVIPPPRTDPSRTPRRHARFTKLRPRAA